MGIEDVQMLQLRQILNTSWHIGDDIVAQRDRFQIGHGTDHNGEDLQAVFAQG